MFHPTHRMLSVPIFALVSLLFAGCGAGGSASDASADGGRVDALALIDAAEDSGTGCGLRTCQSAGAECGPIGDGCGGVIECGDCSEGQYCGGNGPSLCGTGECVPRSCQDQGLECGMGGDGCGGALGDCGPCPDGKVCGGGGKPSKCGSGTPCVPLACSGMNCGPMADGCGALLDCGSCPAGLYCGTVLANVCGGAPCMPHSCNDQGITCGPAGDGCGSVLHCGDCPAGQVCGGAGVPFTCGMVPDDAGVPCVPQSCKAQGISCGPAGDGCGNLLQCGACAAPLTCGGAGTSFQCGQPPPCILLTCQTHHFNCGPASDGCGGLLACGDCPMGQVCGGGGEANVCGGGPTDAGVHLGACDGGLSTVSGVVHAPNGVEPLYNVLVYVADDPPAPFNPGVACGLCAREEGVAVSSVRTGPDGAFQLTVPDGARWLVVQLGRWRRVVDLSGRMLNSCADNPLGDDLTRMPKNREEGDIPLIALATGQVDTVECVLRKIGLDDSEFSAPSGGRRIQIFRNNGADAGPNTPAAGQLWNQPQTLSAYDMVLLACDGHSSAKPAQAIKNLTDYANRGGRIFATHFSYTWIDDANTPFQQSAVWMADGPLPTGSDNIPLLATIEQDPMVNPKGKDFAAWVHLVGADGPMPGTLDLFAARHDVNAVNLPSVRWIYSTQPGTVQHYTFDTPLGMNGGPAGTCGRVLFSDFHVTNADVPPKTTFPSECDAKPLSAQEKVLEFMLFDLASCVGAPPPPGCTPEDCGNQGIQCGRAGDGCGNEIMGGCGVCLPGETCGGGGIPSHCGASAMCIPKTCEQENQRCGPGGDGCGNLLDCGACAGPDGGLCIPRGCGKSDCGATSDGCGGLIANGCGPCQNNCVPTTCQKLGFDCGPTADGCGGIISCGRCKPPATCGANGRPNRCGSIG